MALDPVPWAVAGGVHSADVARSVLYQATGGNEGITAPNDLRVQALPVPGGAVRIMPGGATLLNAYPGASQESYGVRNVTATDLAIPPTDSSGPRTDYIVCRVDDPQFGGQTPADPTVGPYVRFDRVSSLSGWTWPGIALAKITIPASTATITQEMIEDLREMANPRSLEVLRVRPSLMGDAGLTLTATRDEGEWFPNAGGNQLIDIPSWAVRAQIEAQWLGVHYPANVNPYGYCWVEFGPYSDPSRARSTQRFAFDCNKAPNAQRANWFVADDVSIPAAYRGTTQGFTMYARYSGPDRGVSLTATSGATLRIRFLEQPDPSTS